MSNKHFKRSAAIADREIRRTGRIRRWREDWGFIESDDPYDGRDFFIHYHAVPDEADRQRLGFGVRVSFELEPNSETPKATNVRVIC